MDYNDNGQLDAGEPSAITGEDGYATIEGIDPGTWNIRELTMTNWVCTGTSDPAHTAVCYIEATIDSSGFVDDDWFANRPIEGCTPGYWKVPQHWDSWIPTGYDPNGMLKLLFEKVNQYPYNSHFAKLQDQNGTVLMSEAELWQALQFSGGDTVAEKAEILLRAAVAAVLNASHPDVAYGFDADWIIAEVNDALETQDADVILDLATMLDNANNRRCPLH